MVIFRLQLLIFRGVNYSKRWKIQKAEDGGRFWVFQEHPAIPLTTRNRFWYHWFHGNLRGLPPQCHVYAQEIAGLTKALLRETKGYIGP